MYLFAHVFCGALIGTGFLPVTGDRRVLPLCIFGAVLPDLIDKPLALFIPGIFGSSRTIGHTLLLGIAILLAGLFLWQYRHTLLGVALACSVFSHHVLDTIWDLPGTWYFPLLGLFPVILVPDYVRHSLWLEITSPSELVFAWASVVIIIVWYLPVRNALPVFSGRNEVLLRSGTALLLGMMGIYVLIAGLNAPEGTFFAPTYSLVATVMAGLLALMGALVLAFCREVPGDGCRL